MFLRLILENIFSFNDRKEFATTPNRSLKTLKHHVYDVGDVDMLKLSVLYGANAAGKSNLILALDLLQEMILDKKIPARLRSSKFKLCNDKEEQLIAVEFVQDNMSFLYQVILRGDVIILESLTKTKKKSDDDRLIFKRVYDPSSDKTDIIFSNEFEKDVERCKIYKDVLLENFVNSKETMFSTFAKNGEKNPDLMIATIAFKWFSESLTIINPNTKPSGLAHRIDIDDNFKKYVENLMESLNLGIDGVVSEKVDLYKFFGENNKSDADEIAQALDENKEGIIDLISGSGDSIVIVKEKDKYWVKKLRIKHSSGELSADFDLDEESDGTMRLLDFVPAFRKVITKEKVVIIDEIERSIHPLLIKELVHKFSLDENSKGQLLFTTHESNLLDQDIFRQDEIWFVEKNFTGATDVYSLNDFKEHKTKDIQRGYLSGRYGAIPFLANLKDLNWDNNDERN